MTFPLLYDPRIAAKSGDPWTSHDAAEKATSLVATHNRMILAYLERVYPVAKNYLEIGAGTGLDPTAVARRMGKLRDAGLVEDTGKWGLGNGRSGTYWRFVFMKEAA